MSIARTNDSIVFKQSTEGCYRHFFISHCSPAVNQFFAFSIKANVVNLLDHKSISYRNKGDNMDDINGYLEK